MAQDFDKIPMNDSERIRVDADCKTSKIASAKALAPFFEVDLEIKIFGATVFRWKFPPEKKTNLD